MKKRYILLVFIIALAVYSFTLMPGTGYSGDSAKFQFSSRVLGVPHTPGYPAYSIVSHIFYLLPVGTPAYRINLMSAVFAALTVMLLYIVIFRFTNNAIVSFLAAMLFAFSRTFWSQAVVAEVYTVNSFFITLVVLCLLKWEKSRDTRYFFLSCFIYAMSFGHHLTMILLVPAIVYYIFVTDLKVLKPVNILICTGFFILAALQYSYVFLRTYGNAAYVEMWVYNLKDFMWWITGGQFKGSMFAFTFKEFLMDRVPFYIVELKSQFHMIGMVAGLAGLCIMLRDKLKQGMFLLLLLLGNLFFSLNYGIGDIFVFFIPSFIVFSIFIGVGLDAIYRRILSSGNGKVFNRGVIAVLSAGLLIMVITGNYRVANQRENVWSDEFSEFILDKVEANSVIFAPNYAWGQFYLYKLIGEGRRKGDNILAHWYWHYSAIAEARPELAQNPQIDEAEAKKFIDSFSDRDKTVKSPYVFGRGVPAERKLYFQGLSMKAIKKAGINSQKVVSIHKYGYKAELYQMIPAGTKPTLEPVILDDPEWELEQSRRAKRMITRFKEEGVLHIDFSDGSRTFIKEGWSRTELSEGDSLFAWADNLESSLAVPVEKVTGYNISVKAKPFVYEDCPVQKIALYVNDKFVDNKRMDLEWNVYIFEAPAKFWKEGLNTVVFKYGYIASPIEVTGDEDSRDLAVAFSSIKFKSF